MARWAIAILLGTLGIATPLVRLARPDDSEAIWSILGPILRAGDCYAAPQDMTREAALAWWLAESNEVFVAELEHEVVGSYYIRPNQMGGGSHVANCGYMTARQAQGQGVARAMCEHSLLRAQERGFRALQFNFVVGTNERAIRLWRSCGFEVIGTIPGGFQLPTGEFVDVLVMFRRLEAP